MEFANTTKIDKETIDQIQFSESEVLADDISIKERKINLNRALILGNAYRRKVKIIFSTTDGLRQVETTIWAVTDKKIILKGGRLFPIQSVNKVRIF